VNCYLVRENNELTLIDTALGAARIIREASRLMGQPIRRILLTHSHMDHVGSLDALKRMTPDASVMIGVRESRLMAEAARGVRANCMTLLPDEAQTPVRGSFKKVKNIAERLVKHGDRIGSLRAIDTPGHTHGHVAFLDERDGTLYAGDSLVTFQEVRLPFDPPWYFPLTKPATWHYPTALSSARRLLEYDLKRILPGHGPAVEQARSALEKSVERASSALAA